MKSPTNPGRFTGFDGAVLEFGADTVAHAVKNMTPTVNEIIAVSFWSIVAAAFYEDSLGQRPRLF